MLLGVCAISWPAGEPGRLSCISAWQRASPRPCQGREGGPRPEPRRGAVLAATPFDEAAALQISMDGLSLLVLYGDEERFSLHVCSRCSALVQKSVESWESGKLFRGKKIFVRKISLYNIFFFNHFNKKMFTTFHISSVASQCIILFNSRQHASLNYLFRTSESPPTHSSQAICVQNLTK